MFQQEELFDSESTRQFPSPKFIRRPDITIRDRLKIACEVLGCNRYGKVTKLAKDYEVSRQFIYNLCQQLLLSAWLTFGVIELKDQFCKAPSNTLSIDEEILLLRLEGQCSIGAISQVLKRRKLANSSVGYISKKLQDFGGKLSSTLALKEGVNYAVVFASDEVFSKSKPVLITVDPSSSAILRIELSKDRKSPSWQTHWQGILDANIQPIYICNDEGSGMEAARKELLSHVARQSDTFHAIALHLGDIVRQLEEQAYKAIEEEYDCARLLQRAKSESNIEKRRINDYSAKAKAIALIKLYDDYSFWYTFLIEQLQIFDKKGQVLDVTQAQENLKLGLKEIEQLDRYSKTKNEKMKKIITKIRRLLPNLFHFLKYAKKVVESLFENLSCEKEKEALHAIFAAYQHQKNASKARSSKAQKYCYFREEEELICAQILLENTGINFEEYHAFIYEQLQTIVQSSAMVETINSIVRSYFNSSKNQITQAQLNLIMFYHNHRRYTRGKRKGSSPMELLTGKKQEADWLDLLLAESHKPSFSQTPNLRAGNLQDSLEQVGAKMDNIAA